MTTCAAQMQRTENALAEAPCLRDQMITEHLPLVRAIAMRVHGNLPVHVDLDDLIHAGVLGWFDAVNKYDPNTSWPWTKWLSLCRPMAYVPVRRSERISNGDDWDSR